jgi:hypothetical protein
MNSKLEKWLWEKLVSRRISGGKRDKAKVLSSQLPRKQAMGEYSCAKQAIILSVPDLNRSVLGDTAGSGAKI